MFGSSSSNPSSPKDNDHVFDPAKPGTERAPVSAGDSLSTESINTGHNGGADLAASPNSNNSDLSVSPGGTEKRRKSSRAREIGSKIKESLTFPMNTSPDKASVDQRKELPLQKLGKTDPVLSVPTGSFNNSAGESRPGPRSTFRVGVAEDKNKKCRRTMEDTHAYLYNFLSTPAPALSSTGPRATSSESNQNLVLSPSKQTAHVETDNGYFAVFDGHAGSFAADWCGKKVHVLLEEMIQKHPNTPIPELLDMTFTSVDNQLEQLPLKNSGCTAVTAVLRWEDRVPNHQSTTGSTAFAAAAAAAAAAATRDSNDAPQGATPATASPDATAEPTAEPTAQLEAELKEKSSRQRVLYTANVGDARIVLCRSGKALRLSYDHKGSDESEGKRIAGAGGLILNNRVNGVLAVTRALGDAYMKELVTGHPYTTETVIQPEVDEFLILACDGLWDVCTDQEAVDMVRNIQDPQTAAKSLVDHALTRFSTDNLSCMVVRFDSQRIQQAVERKVEPIGVEGDPLSAGGGMSEAEALVDEQRKRLVEGGAQLDQIPSQDLKQSGQEAGPEVDTSAIDDGSGAEGEKPKLPINTSA